MRLDWQYVLGGGRICINRVRGGSKDRDEKRKKRATKKVTGCEENREWRLSKVKNNEKKRKEHKKKRGSNHTHNYVSGVLIGLALMQEYNIKL